MGRQRCNGELIDRQGIAGNEEGTTSSTHMPLFVPLPASPCRGHQRPQVGNRVRKGSCNVFKCRIAGCILAPFGQICDGVAGFMTVRAGSTDNTVLWLGGPEGAMYEDSLACSLHEVCLIVLLACKAFGHGEIVPFLWHMLTLPQLFVLLFTARPSTIHLLLLHSGLHTD